MSQPSIWDLGDSLKLAKKAIAYSERYPNAQVVPPSPTVKQPSSTSAAAYNDVKTTLSLKQRRVLEAIATIGPCCNQQISAHLGLPINSITPRCNELRELGKVELAFKAPYAATGRTVSYWRVSA